MIEQNKLNATSTAVIAISTVIGVLATLIYYLANIKGIRTSIVILISILYLVGVTEAAAYIWVRLK